MPRIRTPDDMMSVEELASIVGLSVPSTRKAIDRGQLPGQHVGQRYLIPREWVHRWLRGEATVTAPAVTDTPIQLVKRVDLTRIA